VKHLIRRIHIKECGRGYCSGVEAGVMILDCCSASSREETETKMSMIAVGISSVLAVDIGSQ
jgi:hypothetical protein